MASLESLWLDYAWGVFHCPTVHLNRCIAAGASTPGPGRRDGNDLRWPGFLGSDYKGILCVSHVHGERNLAFEKSNPQIAEAERHLIRTIRSWCSTDRSPSRDDRFLREYRLWYKKSLSKWDVWTNHYGPLVQKMANLQLDNIAFTNLAKCRVPFEPASKEGYHLIDVCQIQFPIYDLVRRIKPFVVLLSVLPAREGGSHQVKLRGEEVQPRVIAWHGRTGHDRGNTDPQRKAFSEWAPTAAALIRQQAERYRYD